MKNDALEQIDTLSFDRWRCLRCGEEFEVECGERPSICPNPNCGKRGISNFKALSGVWRFFRDDKFIPKRVADEILKNHRFATHRQSHVIYRYNGGVYADDGEEIIREETRRLLGEEATEHRINEVVAHIAETTYTPPEKFNPPKHLINVKNGVLDLNTLELKPHGPNPIFINQLPVEFNPSAKCPGIMKFLGEVLNPDDIPLVQEIVGYCLYRDYPFAKAVMLLGSGNNGKSTLLRLIGALLGEDNVATPSLQDLLRDRFAKAELYGKLANIHADIPAGKLINTGAFKMLTGQDLIYAQRKHRDPFTFRNYAKLLYSANELPPTEDMTEAFWSRWILIVFPNVFPPNDPRTDPNLIDKLTTPEELSGFLNWALEGLRRLLERGHFIETKTTERIKAEWILRTDSLRAFVMRHVRVDSQCSVPKEGFMEAYNDFCENYEVSPIRTGEVTKRLPQLVPRAKLTRPGPRGGKRPRMWVGIRLTEPYEKFNKMLSRVPRVPDESLINYSGSEEKLRSQWSQYRKDIEKTLDTQDTSGQCGKEMEKTLDARDASLRNVKLLLFKKFGVNPFKPSQLSELAPDDDALRRIWEAVEDMRKNGELETVPLESGGEALRIVRPPEVSSDVQGVLDVRENNDNFAQNSQETSDILDATDQEGAFCDLCEQKYGVRRRATRVVRGERGLPIYLCEQCYAEGEGFRADSHPRVLGRFEAERRRSGNGGR